MNALTRYTVAAVATIAGFACGTSGPDVAGHACIVFDLRNTSQCGAMQIVDGLSVVEVESGHHTTTDSSGNFSVAIPTHATSAVLRIAEGRTDRRTSLVAVDVAAAEDVLTPVITPTLWNTYLIALGVPPEDPSRGAIHVSFPAPGDYIGSAQVAGAAQLLYDQGQPFDWRPMPPGDQTIAFMALGVPVDTGTAMVTVVSRTDEVIYSAAVPVEAGAITWVQVGF